MITGPPPSAETDWRYRRAWPPAANYNDPCPSCTAASLEPRGGKHVCPQCGYIQPCCNP